MKHLRINAHDSVEVCRYRAHHTRYGNILKIAKRTGSNVLLTGLVCCFLTTPQTGYADELSPIPPTTEEEIIQQILDEQISTDFTKARGRRNFCQIVLVNEGQLREVPGRARLTSRGAGGRPGVAEVTASRGRYRVSIDAPLGFAFAPNGGNTGVAIRASYSGYGASNFSNRPGRFQKRIKRGTTRIETHLIADRSGGPFPAGNYTAELTLRCE